MAAKYIVQRYARFPIFEPAEGGYYYEGLEPDDLEKPIIRSTKRKAAKALLNLVKTLNKGLTQEDEGFLVCSVNKKRARAFSVNHAYVGDGVEFFVEPINRRGRNSKGRVPYC